MYKALATILSYLAFWVGMNCLVMGAYSFYDKYQAWTFNPEKLVKSLDMESKNALAESLFSNGGEPLDVEKPRRKS